MDAFAERLKELRRASALTQSQLAERLELHPQTVSKWERGLSEPDISQLGALSEALGVSLEKLCGAPEGEQTFTGSFRAEAFGELLSKQRVLRGESQEQLADAMNTSKDAVSRWERGVTCPDIARLCALAGHFQMPLSRLWCGEAEEPAPSAAPVALRRRRQLPLRWAAVGTCALLLLAALLVLFLRPAQQMFTVTVDGYAAEVPAQEWYSPDVPQRDGYDFVGWTDEAGERIDFPCRVEGDITCYAQFSPTEYTVDYWLNGGYFTERAEHTFTVESGALRLPVPKRDGQTFEGWYLAPDYAGSAVESVSCKGADVSVYAKWSDAVYTVRYELSGGTLYGENPSSVTAQEETVLAEPVREGYLFLGWYDEPSGGQRYVTVGGENARNLTLYALWQQTDAQYTVCYHLNGGSAEGNPVSVGAGAVHALPPAYKTGYDFVGWNAQEDGSGEYVTYLCGIGEDMHLYAVYSPRQFVIRYVYEGVYENGQVNPNHISYGERVTLSPVCLAGHEFLGWYDAETEGERVTVIDENNIFSLTTLYARFAPLVYPVTLDAGEGSFSSPEGECSCYTYPLVYGEELVLPVPERAGYTFLGWQNEAGETVKEVNVLNVCEMRLTAQWRANTDGYRVEYVLGGGTLEAPNPALAVYGQCLPLADPVREGYVFLGWYDNAQGVGERYYTLPAERADTLTLYAVWQQIFESGSAEDFDYRRTEDFVTVTSYTGAVGKYVDVVIPAVIDGLPVTRIGGGTSGEKGGSIFGGTSSQTAAVRSVTISEGVTEIGAEAFAWCSAEEPVVLPSTLVRVGRGAFRCFGGTIRFADGSRLTSVGEYAFDGVTFEGALVLPSLRVAEVYSFHNVKAVALILPDTVTTIMDQAFYSPNGYIRRIFLPASVEYVGFSALSGQVYTSHSEASGRAAGISADVWNVTAGSVTLCDGGAESTLYGCAISLPRPQKEGYTFLGWRTAAGERVPECYIPCCDGDGVTLYAAYEARFDGDGRTAESAFCLREGVAAELSLEDGAPFYFTLGLASSARIVFSFTGDFRGSRLLRLRGEGTQQLYTGQENEHHAGDLYSLRIYPVSPGTTVTLRVIVLSTVRE